MDFIESLEAFYRVRKYPRISNFRFSPTAIRPNEKTRGQHQPGLSMTANKMSWKAQKFLSAPEFPNPIVSFFG